MFRAATTMVLQWKNVEDFRCKIRNINPHFKNLYLARKRIEELTLVWFESLFQGLHILLYNIFGQTIYWSTAKPQTSPKKHSNDLERSKFRQQLQSFVCVPPWRRVTFKFWEMLKDASEVTLVPTNIFLPKIFNLVQSFVEYVQSKSGWRYIYILTSLVATFCTLRAIHGRAWFLQMINIYKGRASNNNTHFEHLFVSASSLPGYKLTRITLGDWNVNMLSGGLARLYLHAATAARLSAVEDG
jgi:hypothetical protein